MPGTRPSRKYPRKPRLSKKTNRKTKKNPKSNKKLSRKQRAGRRPKNTFSKCLEHRYCNQKFLEPPLKMDSEKAEEELFNELKRKNKSVGIIHYFDKNQTADDYVSTLLQGTYVSDTDSYTTEIFHIKFNEMYGNYIYKVDEETVVGQDPDMIKLLKEFSTTNYFKLEK